MTHDMPAFAVMLGKLSTIWKVLHFAPSSTEKRYVFSENPWFSSKFTKKMAIGSVAISLRLLNANVFLLAPKCLTERQLAHQSVRIGQ